MKAYLKGFYGYQNFGDELLLLGVIQRIFSNYQIEELVIESGDQNRLENRLKDNLTFMSLDLSKIKIVSIQQHKHKYITHLLNFLGFGRYKKYFKFFGGGEVLNIERKFPRNGRNIALLHRYSVRKKQFVLLGGIGKISSPNIQKLYKKLLPKAQKIILREKDSFDIVNKFFEDHKNIKNKPDIELYKDFSSEVIENIKSFLQKTPEIPKNIFTFGQIKQELVENSKKVINFLKNGKTTNQVQQNNSQNYILINVNSHIFNKNTVKKIKKYCEQNQNSKKIFFPCDMNDDLQYFEQLKDIFPNLELFDRREHSLFETLTLFSQAIGGIGARLHFLYPLKILGIPFEPIIYKDKVRKLIINT